MVLQQRSETEVPKTIDFIQSGEIAKLSTSLALHAARITPDIKISMADSTMLEATRDLSDVLWTQDAVYARLEEVKHVRTK